MRSASQLAEARSVDEVLSVHGQIVGAQIAQTFEVWRSLWLATDTVRQAYDLTPRGVEAANAPERRPQEQQRKSA